MSNKNTLFQKYIFGLQINIFLNIIFKKTFITIFYFYFIARIDLQCN